MVEDFDHPPRPTVASMSFIFDRTGSRLLEDFQTPVVLDHWLHRR